MLSVLLWYLIISTIGLLSFPLTYRLLPALADRGYALSRILGLLLWGYLFWLLGSLGILRNNSGGALLAALLVMGLSAWALKGEDWQEFRKWLRDQRRMIGMVEILFLVAFAGWAYVRSANPEIVGTEKPMELAFINAILRSPTLPPNDPWLSGYSISYYYFGYVLIAMIARLAGTSAGVAFNLGVSLVFALCALGSYGVLYNLLSHQPKATNRRTSSPIVLQPRLSALLGPFFVLIISNLGGFLHLLRLMGVFWRVDQNGQPVSRIWTWLEMGSYAQPPPAEAFPHWWWWQASRIIQDFDFNGANKGDIIDEFPFFTYLLADLHPHVLAMPFAFLAISLALNLFLGGGRGHVRWFWMKFRISPLAFLLASVVLGSLAFFNTWDFPFYVALFAGAYILREMVLEGDETAEFSEGSETILRSSPSLGGILFTLIKLGFALGVSGAFLYLPFYFGFQSQAGGPLPNLIYITRGVYLWIHFVPFLVPIFGLLFHLWNSDPDRGRFKAGLKLTLGLVMVLLSITLLLSILIASIQIFKSINPQAAIAADAFLGSMAAPGWWPVLLEGFKRRLTVPGTLLTLMAILSLTLALLWPRTKKRSEDTPSHFIPISLSPATIFVLLLILVGALLVLAPEFVFLRDLFGYRINTVFKFYFQVWLMWGIAAAYACILLWRDLRGGVKIVFQVGMGLVVVLSLIYPAMSLWSKTNGFQPNAGLTLDGTAYLESSNPDEAGAMAWLRNAPLGVVAEAIGGSYTQYARMSVNSGQPTVLGWEFHEMQWRGGTEEMGSRRADIERLYCTSDWDEAQSILSQYDVRYVIVGDMEFSAYQAGSEACPPGLNGIKFIRHLPLAYQSGQTSIYLVP
jgi:YYY domain-containing protein